MKSYYDFAHNDYLYLKDVDTSKPTSYNSFCALSQKTCERFLKHIVDQYVRAEDIVSAKEKEDVLKTHSLRKLYTYLKQYLPDFVIDRNVLYMADSYYFAVQYPGDNAYFATKEDVDACDLALTACKDAVAAYVVLQEELLQSHDTLDKGGDGKCES